MTRTLALVESPGQLLNVVEWAHHRAQREPLADGVTVAILLPADSLTRYQLAMTAAVARAAGVAVDSYEIRRGGARRVGAGAALVRDLVRAGQLVIGDPFSGVIQAMLPLTRAHRIVVVDDGTATLEYVDCLRAGKPLVRWRVTGAGPPQAARAGHRLSPRAGHDVHVFSAMSRVPPGAPADPGPGPGPTWTVNAYDWTRNRSDPDVIAGADIVGASLVETGVIHREAYLRAVAVISRRHGATRYLAHRREAPDKLAEITARTGLPVVRPDVPIELALRSGPVSATVLTFPSTPAHTLPIVLAGTGVQTHLYAVGPSWFCAGAGPYARAFVQRITGPAGARPVLQGAG